MPKNSTEFSRYATAFFEIIDGAKSGRAAFVKDLLKIGLTDEDKDYLDESFPTVNNYKGQRSIEKNKADILRKYLRGDNDISDIVSYLETEFDLEFQQRYSEELLDYEESRIIEFAKKLELDINENDIDIVSEAIADYYSSLIKRAATKKSRTHKTDKDKSISDMSSQFFTYTFSESEKKEVKNICSLIDESLKKLHKIGVAINGIRSTIHNYYNEPKWRLGLWNCLREQTELYNNEYDICSQYCSALVSLLKTKVRIKTCIKALYDIANEIVDNKYIASQKDYNLEEFNTMMKKFQDNHKQLLECIDEL